MSLRRTVAQLRRAIDRGTVAPVAPLTEPPRPAHEYAATARREFIRFAWWLGEVRPSERARADRAAGDALQSALATWALLQERLAARPDERDGAAAEDRLELDACAEWAARQFGTSAEHARTRLATAGVIGVAEPAFNAAVDALVDRLEAAERGDPA